MPIVLPFLQKPFEPKKASLRKSVSLSNLHNMNDQERAANFGIDYGLINVKLDKEELTFRDGEWLVDVPGKSSALGAKESQRLRNKIKETKEENNLLKMKVDILLDMLTEHSSEINLLEKQLKAYESPYN